MSDHVFAFGVVWVVVGCCVVEIGVVQQLTETIKTMSVLLVQDRGGYRIMGTYMIKDDISWKYQTNSKVLMYQNVIFVQDSQIIFQKN